MAILRHLETGVEVQLGARHLVGRSTVCQLRLASANVSGVHAELVWVGNAWQIQDLGSRNGTYVDERKLVAGERSKLELGATLTFAENEHRYRLVDADGPRLSATSERGELVLGEAGLLHLPSVDACEVSVFHSPADSAWVVETERETRAIEDQERIVVAGEVWRVTLPAEVAETRDATRLPASERDLAELVFEFSVSRDGEHVSLALVDPRGGEPIAIEARAHLMLLLALAQARLADAEQDHLGASEHGWLYRDQLETELGIDGQLLNLWVHRARRQLAQAGVQGVGRLVERRAQAQQLRIGAARLVIHRG